MWKYKHNIQTEIEDTPGGSTISMSALGNTSHTTQTTNSKHCEILIKRILINGAISQLYRNKFQNVFSPMRQISKQALQQVGFFFRLSSLSLSSRNSSNTLQLYWMFKFFLLLLGFEYVRWSMQWWKKDSLPPQAAFFLPVVLSKLLF